MILIRSCIAAFAALSALHAHAQTGAVAINPLLTKPASAVTPEEVTGMQQRLADWPELTRYREANARLPAKQPGIPRIVFYGDSITQNWGEKDPSTFFPGKGYINRGIGGQTSPQLLLRFSQDVIALKPEIVVILAGTNDLAGNTGLATQSMIEDNLHAMVDLARAHGIGVVLASVLPVSDYPWLPGTSPAPKVRSLNAALERYAAAKGVVYLDYYSALTNAEGGIDRSLAFDGVHPTAAGYAVMAPLAEAAIARALGAVPASRR